MSGYAHTGPYIPVTLPYPADMIVTLTSLVHDLPLDLPASDAVQVMRDIRLSSDSPRTPFYLCAPGDCPDDDSHFMVLDSQIPATY